MLPFRGAAENLGIAFWTDHSIIGRAAPCHRAAENFQENPMPMPRLMFLPALVLVASAAGAADGLVALKSPHGVKETADRFEAAARAKGLNIFLRVDHAAGAKKVGKDLRPTELLVFGNPQGGTPLMECVQTAGIDLPLKALAWQDASGQVWLGYNDPKFLVSRHGAADCGPVVANLTKALAGLAQEAVR
jgi:uncharacterized protein (DUF302 family)